MRKIVYALLILSLSLNAWLMRDLFVKQENVSVRTDHIEKQYPLLSQRILIENRKEPLIHFVPLRADLRKMGDIYGSDFSLYFEYLPTGLSIGINDKIEFYSASLLKVPLVMAYYRQVEKAGQHSVDPEIILQEKHINKESGQLWKRGVGSKVRLSEAVKLTLTESDNTAAHIVGDQVQSEDLRYIFDGLDIVIKTNITENTSVITTKAYSSILKSLYFSSLLTKENSQLILSYLANSTTKDMLPQGVGSDVQVANKIGAYKDEDMVIYSDCGIVYVPSKPYLLCMASRSDYNTAAERMRKASKVVYDFVASR